MRFDYAPDDDYSDLASGTVLRSAPGFPGFPVRVGLEVFDRAAALLGSPTNLTVWDPLSGSGQLLTTIALMRQRSIDEIIASDISSDAVDLATRNLSLLHNDGMRARRDELFAAAEEHGRPAYKAAAAAAERLLRLGSGIERTTAGVADAMHAPQLENLLGEREVDVVIADVPYGQQTDWASDESEPIPRFLRSVASVLPRRSVIAVIASGRSITGVSTPAFRSLRHGTRAIKIFRAGDLQDAQ